MSAETERERRATKWPLIRLHFAELSLWGTIFPRVCLALARISLSSSSGHQSDET